MQVRIVKVCRKDQMPPRQGESVGSIAWRLIVSDGTQEIPVWARSEDSSRGRQYDEGTDWEVTFPGGDISDRDATDGINVWRKAKFDKIGQGRRGGGQQRPQSGPQGGQQAAPGPQRTEIARDIFAEKNFGLFFQNLQIAQAMRAQLGIECSDAVLEEHASKLTNMMWMAWNIVPLRVTAAKLNEELEAERQRQEAEEARKKAEEEERKRQESVQRMRQASSGDSLDI